MTLFYIHFSGDIKVSIEGTSNAEIKMVDNPDGSITVNYTPLVPGDYLIQVKYKGKPMPGSPYTAKVSGLPTRRAAITIGAQRDFIACEGK